jgi:hypothetical protein
MAPTCPTNNNYKQTYLAIKYEYDTKCLITNDALQGYINTLDIKVKNYQNLPATATEADRKLKATDLSGAFQPITQHYSNLISIKKRLNDFLECSADQIHEADPISINKERYSNRASPQDTVMPRELVFGFFSQLRPSSVPIVIAAGVFMSCLALLIIFQMFGFTGEIHSPPALANMQGWLGTVPLYQNPMVLSGISIVLGVAVIILGVMYYRSKK